MTTTPMNRLIEIMARLRHPKDGCAWDLEQTFKTIAPHTIEEAYEVADAIEHEDMAALKDELGDLLLQVVFHAQMAEEQGQFVFDDVATAICEKLVRRHPHVFSDTTVKDAADQTRLWEALKADERQARADASGGDGRPVSALDGVSTALPALSRALKLQNRAARIGFDWPEAAEVVAKIEEELAEIKAALARDAGPDAIDEEIGDLLFACVNFTRKLGLDPESALRRGNIKFDRRFRRMESFLAEASQCRETASLEEMEALWQRVKNEEKESQSNDN